MLGGYKEAERKKRKKEMYSFDTSLPHKVLSHLPLLIITIFAHCEPWERGKALFAPASYLLGGLDVADVSEQRSWTELLSSQCGG